MVVLTNICGMDLPALALWKVLSSFSHHHTHNRLGLTIECPLVFPYINAPGWDQKLLEGKGPGCPAGTHGLNAGPCPNWATSALWGNLVTGG